MRYITAKKIIQANNNFNLIRGCTHGCIYCDSRSVCYQVDDFENIAVKENALKLIEHELSRKRKKTMLTTGAMSDPYVHAESHLRLMEGTLKLIEKYGFGISVLTKSKMILRDINLYKKINNKYKAIVQLTITTTDDELAKIIEPNVSLPSERLNVLKAFSDEGITTGIWMTPLLPFISDTEENIKSIVKKASECGVKFIINFGIGTTMREGSRDYFYQKLDESFPGLKAKYIATYGEKYICDSPNALYLKRVFEQACIDHKILYKHQEIWDLFKYEPNHQLSLF